MGWSLSFGVTDITRKTSKGIPKYEDSVGAESDTFILSGHEDLVVADEPPVDIRTLQVIERWTNLDDDGDTTISPSNQVHFFGRTDQSRIFDASNPKMIFTWMLCEVHDPLGNAMVYVYKEEDEAGIPELPDTRQTCEAGRDGEARARARYFKAIKYVNRKPSREAESWEIEHQETSKVGNVENEWMFEVVLDYGEHHVFEPSANFVRDWNVRHAPFSTYVSGFEILSYRLYKRILMFHHIPDKLGLEDYLVASCELYYLPKETGSFIRSVTQKGHTWNLQTGQYDTQSLPAISFEYSQVPEFAKLQTNSIKPKLICQLAASQANPTRTYDYDICDNILKICHTTEDERSANWVREYEYSDLEANNRLARTKVQGRWEHYTYDKGGCMTSMSGYSNVGWNVFQRLKSRSRQRVKQSKNSMTSSDGQSLPEITWFVYNSDGTLVRKVTDQLTAAQGQNPKGFKETLYLDSCDVYRKYHNLGDGSLKPKVETYTSLVKEHQETVL
ncbi:rhs repeat-associated core domain-containing protein [Fusarium circinatum]|uniref:Rhs repeat-associated core domain-containing protein n=1 Tax=Fusarium circinatum TaxID=48490 RepID=A0A8H5WYH5_FUSCI|nr:rhs repeat-associated core domain-containing protein [Fusarium circinatum]